MSLVNSFLLPLPFLLVPAAALAAPCTVEGPSELGRLEVEMPLAAWFEPLVAGHLQDGERASLMMARLRLGWPERFALEEDPAVYAKTPPAQCRESTADMKVSMSYERPPTPFSDDPRLLGQRLQHLLAQRKGAVPEDPHRIHIDEQIRYIMRRLRQLLDRKIPQSTGPASHALRRDFRIRLTKPLTQKRELGVASLAGGTR